MALLLPRSRGSVERLVIAGAVGYFAFDVAALAAAFHAVGSAGLP